jgi:hypothetical protein
MPRRRKAQRESLEFLKTPDALPWWPVAPLTRGEAEEIEYGVVVLNEDNGDDLVFLAANLLDVAARLDWREDPSPQRRGAWTRWCRKNRLDYPSFESIVDDGWIVD